MHCLTSTQNGLRSLYLLCIVQYDQTIVSCSSRKPCSAHHIFRFICNFPCCYIIYPVAKALMWCTKHWKDCVGLFCLSGLRLEKNRSAVMSLVLWQGGEGQACHSGLFLSQQGFDVHWQPQITLPYCRNICFLNVFGLAPRDRTQTQSQTVDCNRCAWVCNFSRRKKQLLHLKQYELCTWLSLID